MSRGENAGNAGQGMNWIRREKRYRIYDRDGWRCVWCSAPLYCTRRGEKVTPRGECAPVDRLATLDHVLPRSNGGTNHESNLVTSCIDCNEKRGDRSAIAFAFELNSDFPHVILDRVIEAMGKVLPPARKAAA